MDLELLKVINLDLTWSAVKKGQRSMKRRLRRTKPSGSELGFHSGSKMHDSVTFDYEKSGVAILGQHFAEEALEFPIKKRILLRQSPGQGARSSQPQTSSPHHELPMSTEHVSVKDVPKLNDFSGIELLAATACRSSIYDTSVHVESSAVEEHSTPRVSDDSSNQDNTFPVTQNVCDSGNDEGVKGPVQDNTFPVTQNVCDSGNDEGVKGPVSSKNLRLHWDLNTVMDEWEEPSVIFVDHQCKKSYLEDVNKDGLQNETRYPQVTGDEQGISGRPDVVVNQVNGDGGYLEKRNDVESSVSKSDVVDSFASFAKCENISTSTASVSLEEATVKVESDDKQAVSEVLQGGCLSLKGDTVDKLASEDHLSDCCGSNVSQDKVKSGYDSPVEDGELREPATHTWEKEELEELECVDYESDNMYEDNSDTIESVTNEIVIDHPQTNKASVSIPINDIELGDQADALGSKHSQPVIIAKKDSSSKEFVSERKNMVHIHSRPTSCIHRSRSERDFRQENFMGREGSSYHDGQWVDSFSGNKHGSSWYSRPKNVRSGGESNSIEAIQYNPRGVYRNESYDMHSGIPPSRDISRDRSRVELRRASQEEFNNPDPCYSERKVLFFASSFDRGVNISRSQKQSRTRSRSGSPIAWHFQKKRNMDAKRRSPENEPETRFPFRKPSETEAALVSQPIGHVTLQCVSRSFDDRNVIDGQHRDRRSSPVRTFHRTNQRHDPPEYVGKLKSNDRFRPRFPPSSSYNSIHVDKYGTMNERRRLSYDNVASSKGYSRNKDNGFRHARFEYKGYRDPENTSEVKGCRYPTNRMLNTGGHFHKDN
ncbi:hypothetical protein R6Q57_002362 [Mikania cordata]